MHQTQDSLSRRLGQIRRQEVLVRVVVGDLAGIQATHPVLEFLRPGERHFHRNLLIEKHSDHCNPPCSGMIERTLAPFFSSTPVIQSPMPQNASIWPSFNDEKVPP